MKPYFKHGGELWAFNVGNTNVNPCLPHVWEGEDPHSTYARQLTLHVKRKISNGEHVQLQPLKLYV